MSGPDSTTAQQCAGSLKRNIWGQQNANACQRREILNNEVAATGGRPVLYKRRWVGVGFVDRGVLKSLVLSVLFSVSSLNLLFCPYSPLRGILVENHLPYNCFLSSTPFSLSFSPQPLHPVLITTDIELGSRVVRRHISAPGCSMAVSATGSIL